MTDDSIFTRIIRGELPGRFVWREAEVVAFGTIAPIRPGHVLVVPVHQVDKWTDLPPEVWVRTMVVAQAIAQVLETTFECDRVGVIVAGLEVPHCHVHLIPIRSEGDLNFALADPGASAVSLDEAAERIRVGLRAAGHEEHVPD
jgi:diadenosine tetraphosphate (Ap4A) HIT family hydrolase